MGDFLSTAARVNNPNPSLRNVFSVSFILLIFSNSIEYVEKQ
jgi:hypothetical protein